MSATEPKPPRPLRLLASAENGILITLLLCMIALAGAQIVMRNVFHSGYVDGDQLLRILVLWVGLFGAVVATRDDKHIAIDLLTRYFSAHLALLVRAVVQLFVALICGIISYHSVRFVILEYDSGTMAFGAIPAWVAELVLPLAFGIMTVRHTLILVFTMTDYWQRRRPT